MKSDHVSARAVTARDARAREIEKWLGPATHHEPDPGSPRLILVCGSRDWTDRRVIRARLKEIIDRVPVWADEPTVIHGDARGADRIAAEEAQDLGFWVGAHPADWKKHGKAAGPIRNRQMLDEKPDLVLAFQRDDSRGTQDTIDEARRRGIPVEVQHVRELPGANDGQPETLVQTKNLDTPSPSQGGTES